MDSDIRSQLAKLEGSLQRYLPASLFQALVGQAGPAASTGSACAAQLDALLEAVSTYLPRYLVDEQLRDPQPGQVSGRFREATIMFADISGFTAMSEQLSRQGQQGAEAITHIVDDYFTTMLDIAARWGGDLIKFGGDALLIAFFGDDHAPGSDHALAACQAAAQMQQAMDRFARVKAPGVQGTETFGLKMTVGLGTGPLFAANLGTRTKMEYTVMGEALAHMAHAEDRAAGGEIYIDRATYQAARPYLRVGEACRGRTPAERCYPLLDVDGTESGSPILRQAQDSKPQGDIARDGEHTPERTPGQTTAHMKETVACLDALVPFLPPGLLDMLRFDPRHMARRERGEFRPVTTVFCNFYGIEEIIRQLGPSRAAEITAILNAHFCQMQRTIDRYEGVLDKVDSYVVGHRIMALFGAPRAHVDDPERAVRAAWEMQSEMEAFHELETSAGVYALKQRIGINTGRVFAGNVGSDTRHEYSVMGDEVNLTARLMSVAQEGQVLISESTATQVGPHFRLDEQSPVMVKGKSRPVPNYAVRGIAARETAARGTERQPERRAPLVGRDEEWQTIQHVANLAYAGAGQVLDIHGEMGMGKSRIIQELVEYWTARGGAVYLSACASYGRHTPYAPWATILNGLLSLHEKDSAREQIHKIMARLASIRPEWADGLHPPDWAPLIAQLLGVPMPADGLYPPDDLYPAGELLRSLDPKLRQQNLRRIIHGLLLSEAQRQPTLLVLDDVQWIDESSLALLDHLAAHSAPFPLLTCIAHRPEDTDHPVETSQLSQQHDEYPNRTPIALQALTDAESMALLESQLPIVPENAADETRWQRLKELILKNAQGNPLFIVEMAHALIENNMRYDAERGAYRARTDLDRVYVPDTVSRVILSRLDRLDEQSQNVLKVASVIGHEFQHWLLRAVYPYHAEDAEMEDCLLALCEKELLDRSEARRLIAYLFRHVMMREVAYESLLYAERRDLHRRIAHSVQAQGAVQEANPTHSTDGNHPADQTHPADKIHPYAEALAQHYTLAEDWPHALQYQTQAGHRARAIYANEDAIHRFREALRIAEYVPDSQDRQLEAHEALSQVLATVGDYDAAMAHNDHAIALVMEQDTFAETTARHLADLFREMASICEKKSDYVSAFDWLQGGLLALEGIEGIEAARIYLMGAGIYHRQGDNARAQQWCQHSLDIVGRNEAQDPSSMSVMAHTYYLQGAICMRYGDAARSIEVCQRSLDLYQQLGDLAQAGSAHNNLANAYFYRGDWAQATEHYARALSIKTQIGDVHECGMISNNLGGVYLNRGQLDQAENLYRQSLQTWQKLGSAYGEAFLHMNLAAVALKRSQWKGALELLARGQELVDQIGARDLLPEVYRYVAEAYLGLGQIEQAADWAAQSIHIAREHETKLEEGATRRVLGQIHHAHGDLRAAERELGASLALLEALNSQYQVAQTLYQLARLHVDTGQEDLARQEKDRAIAAFQRLGAQLDLEQALR